MTPLGLTSAITAIANALACGLTPDKITLLSSALVQLADTLATIATVKNVTKNNQDCPNKK